MLKSINIRNFKGIRELDEPISLSKITVLIGRNESGKSSILEAIYLAASATQGFMDPITRTSAIDVLSRKYLSLHNLIFKGSDNLEIELDIDHQGEREKITILATPYEYCYF
ncbi:MAG: AAA family ATPase [Crenarchaeota archaeon]|nr:AAA family ATPase [Thermoproteota archaeon]